jgi:hypothetical protein
MGDSVVAGDRAFYLGGLAGCTHGRRGDLGRQRLVAIDDSGVPARLQREMVDSLISARQGPAP